MAIRTVVMLSTRLMSHRTFIRIEFVVGRNSWGGKIDEVSLDDALPMEFTICDSRNIIWSLGSGWSVWYVCTTNAERTLEKRPAYKRKINTVHITCMYNITHENQLILQLVFPSSALSSVLLHERFQQCFPVVPIRWKWIYEWIPWLPSLNRCCRCQTLAWTLVFANQHHTSSLESVSEPVSLMVKLALNEYKNEVVATKWKEEVRWRPYERVFKYRFFLQAGRHPTRGTYTAAAQGLHRVVPFYVEPKRSQLRAYRYL